MRRCSRSGERAPSAVCAGAASEGPAALMRGTLVVGDDPAKFAELLRCGVGRHRAYGFGMLLVRPPKPAGAG